jgi:hypothetical protein
MIQQRVKWQAKKQLYVKNSAAQERVATQDPPRSGLVLRMVSFTICKRLIQTLRRCNPLNLMTVDISFGAIFDIAYNLSNSSSLEYEQQVILLCIVSLRSIYNS